MRAVHRDLVLDIGLAGDDRAILGVDVLAADKEMALLGNGERADTIRLSGASCQRRKQRGAADRQYNSHGSRAHDLPPENGASLSVAYVLYPGRGARRSGAARRSCIYSALLQWRSRRVLSAQWH